METNSNTLIVVMPVYNSEKTLDAAILSVLSQSHKNLRLFIVDDCSSDSSLEIAKKYLADPRVKVFKNNTNMGAYYCRNVGLYYARDLIWGYFTCHDSDDISFEHRYLKIITKLKASGATAAIEDRVRRVNLYTKKFIREHDGVSHAVFKRLLFNSVGYFEVVRFAADWEHWERAKAWCNEFGYSLESIEEVLGEFYVHENNLTVLIPGKSKARMTYVQKSKRKFLTMLKNKNWYVPFETSYITEEL